MISHDYKLIFIHIPKCAGRSVCDVFNQRFDHFTLKYYISEYKPFYSQYNKFTIVRHPLDRIVSLYHYIREHRRHQYEPIAANIGNFKLWLLTNIQNYRGDFNDASSEGARGTDGCIGSSFWFSSMASRITNYEGKIGDIGIFKMDDNMNTVEKFLSSWTNTEIKLPHVNKSEYTDFRSYFDGELRAVLSVFKPIIEDCERFNYSF